jgi:microcystin-dependent protein
LAGTIFGLGLTQQFDSNGEKMSGCLLYLYEAGTSTPATAYEDFGLTSGLEHPHPIVADASARLPAFWLADGSYRVRLTDAQGNEIFDESSITAIGASSGTASGGGVSNESIFQTGDTIWIPRSGTRSGWVRGNGRTIGSTSSGATERANSDCEDLFTHFWNNYTDTVCPVTGGRGANAAADWAANKRIATPDMRGKAPFGLDDMGNSAASIITGGTTPGATGGSEDHTMTQSELVAHTHGTGTLATSNAGAHSHTVDRRNGTGGGFDAANLQTASGTPGTVGTHTSSSEPNHNHNITGSVASTGSGDAFDIMNPYMLGTWYFKL